MDTSRNIGTEFCGAGLPVIRQPIFTLDQSEQRPGIGRSAAQPRRHRQVFFQCYRPALWARQGGQRLHHDVVKRISQRAAKFATGAQFVPRCRTCDLDYAAFNVGDGPAAFLTLIIGAAVTGLALWLEVAVHPPFWVHIVLWVPITAGAVIWGLRAGKAALLAAEFQRRAGEAGREP